MRSDDLLMLQQRPSIESTLHSSPAILEPLEPRLLLSGVEYLPGLVGPEDLAKHANGQMIYLDFDGELGVSYDNDALGVYVSDVDMNAFALSGTLAGHE